MNASAKCLAREPDAGNLHVRFDEGEGGQRSKALRLSSRGPLSTLLVRAFVQLREVLSGHKELAQKIAQLERKLGDHDQQIHVLVEAIKQLIDPKLPPKIRRIGFRDD